MRNGTQPHHPILLSTWLSVDVPSADACPMVQWHHYCEQALTLIDTIADDLVPMQWRQWCLDAVHTPLHTLSMLANTQEQEDYIDYLYYNLDTTSHYAFAGLNL